MFTTMKKVFSIIAFGILVSLSTVSLAQSSSQKKAVKRNSDVAVDKQKTVSPDRKKAKEFANTELKTDDKNRQVKIINGRKVLVDNQGVQSLVNTDDKNVKTPSKEIKSEQTAK